MKGELLSIGEVSKMKGIGVKSLRYYERVGVLTPAYVDPSSGYRYYSMRQMVDIDIITTCIDLGIPLRELKSFMGEDKAMDLEALLGWSRDMAIRNLRKAEITLSQLDGYLDETRAQRQFARMESPYERGLPEQLMVCRRLPKGKFNLKRYITAATELYEQAKAAGIVPLYSQGIVSLPDGEAPGPSWSTFVSIEVPSWMTNAQVNVAIETAGDGRIAKVPAGDYRGWRVTSPTLGSCFERVLSQCDLEDTVVFASEIWDAGINGSDYEVEVLVRR